MLRKILRMGAGVGLLTANLLFGQFKRVDPAQPPYPSQQSDPAQQPYAGQPYPPQPNQQQMGPDGPGEEGPDAPVDPADAQHGVARVSFIGGEVNVQRSGSGGTVAAAMNAPLLAGDRLQTGNGSSAEMQLNAGTMIRVGQNSNVGFGALGEGRFQAQLGIGTAIYRVVQPSQLDGELDTPNIAIRPLGPVDMRVSVLDDGTTEINMRQGEAEIVGPQGTERLEAGHGYLVRGNPADPEFQEVAPALRDEFDEWSDGRDQELSNSRSAQYVGPDVPGTADLDGNGNWVPSSYGTVWTPSGMPANWAPYSDGSWSYENYYGWTWIDNASWGWAPYHYGRWFRNGGYGWCWWPGARTGFHYWRPAVVGFYGWGGGYRGLGWVPLAPHERFYGWWGRGGRAFGYGGAGSYPAYRNAGFRGAVMFASYHNFGGPGQHFSHLSGQQLAGASVLGGRIPVAPNRSSYSFSQRQAFSITRSASYSNRSFVSAERYHGVDNGRAFRSPGYSSPVSRGNWNRVGLQATPSASRGAQRTNQPSQQRSPGTGGSGWQRFGDPGGNGAYRQGFSGNSSAKPGNESGWHEFGRPTSPSNARQWNAPSSNQQRNQQQRFEGNGSWNRSQPRSNGGSQQHFSAPARSSPQGHSNGGGGGNRGGGGGNRGGGGHR